MTQAPTQTKTQTPLDYRYCDRWLDYDRLQEVCKALARARIVFHDVAGSGDYRTYRVMTVNGKPCEERYNPYIHGWPLELPGGAVAGLVGHGSFFTRPEALRPEIAARRNDEAMVLGLLTPFQGFSVPANLDDLCREAIAKRPRSFFATGKSSGRSSDLFVAHSDNLQLKGRGTGTVATNYDPRYPVGKLGEAEMPVKYNSGWWPQVEGIMVMAYPDGWKFFQHGTNGFGGFNEIATNEIPWDKLVVED